ncbi:MAG: hypothetical protein WBB94_02500 [Candidatus Saccharimonadaceae bacterium]
MHTSVLRWSVVFDILLNDGPDTDYIADGYFEIAMPCPDIYVLYIVTRGLTGEIGEKLGHKDFKVIIRKLCYEHN